MLKRAYAKRRNQPAPVLPLRTTHQLRLVPPPPPRVLLVCDSAARTAKLTSALTLGTVEIVSVSYNEELRGVTGQTYTLAVIDVAPAKLLEVLKTMWASPGISGLPVFVEASEISAEASLAGVLPQYRAMPCSYTELVTLVRRRLAPAPRPTSLRKVL